MKIEQKHLRVFLDFLKKLESVDIYFENFKTVVKRKLKGRFPSRESFAMIAATQESLGLFDLVFSVTSPPSHVSENAPLLELKVLDKAISYNQGKPWYIIWLSVFPTGRMVLGMEGLTLDTTESHSDLKGPALFMEKRYYGTNSRIDDLRKELVEKFPIKEESERNKEIQKEAIDILTSEVNQN